ncbi:hypothetical protein [Variovorax sp. YR216]|uniref:hypothetical protein n=1 Tax=Variovorax sp. YR216 TaxID=1882828 RepID=UPI000B898181|nr:hypothetical protein [Variovorax sp. YR216]
MQFFVFLASLLATAALVVAFDWPVLLAGFALAFGTFLFSTADTEAGESSRIKPQSPPDGAVPILHESNH